MHDFDSYTLYEIKKRNVFSCRIKLILKDPINADVLKTAAEKAFKRFPYYSRTVSINDENAYILNPSDKPITVTPDDHIVRLGTEETNGLLFAITYEENNIYFSFAHNFCGGCGAMFWIKTTLWQYLTDLGHKLAKTAILTPDKPITAEETAEPDVDSLPMDEPIGNFNFAMDAFTPVSDYIEHMKNPNAIIGYYPIVIPKKELMQYARDNDGSPNSIIAALLFKMSARVNPDNNKFNASIACNYRSDVGCPESYRDMVRMLSVTYDAKMKDWPAEKLSTMTRSRMYLQMQPECSWKHCRKVDHFRKEIDAAPDFEAKVDYAVNNSPTTHGVPASFVISYVGKVEWGELAPFIDGAFSITYGHIMLEINATNENFCISFQTLRSDGKYFKEFLKVLDEEKIKYTAGELENRKLPEIILPPFDK
ncbi:MAG: hypothetical protein K5894_16395 [Lachnospiraceae bacterium]|nr:hypothetical protein [Lachnospiraceae bacterium]